MQIQKYKEIANGTTLGKRYTEKFWSHETQKIWHRILQESCPRALGFFEDNIFLEAAWHIGFLNEPEVPKETLTRIGCPRDLGFRGMLKAWELFDEFLDVYVVPNV